MESKTDIELSIEACKLIKRVARKMENYSNDLIVLSKATKDLARELEENLKKYE